MDLIDRYVVEVTRHLPNRGDVPEELRALLNDALEARAEREGRPADDDLAADVLRQFGSPAVAAARYTEPQCLVGPGWYPTFEWIVGTVVVVRVIAGAVGILGRFISTGYLPSASAIPGAIWAVLQFALITIGLSAVVISTLEVIFKDREDTWNPRELPAIKTLDASKSLAPTSLEYGIGGLVIGLVLLNVWPQWWGMILTGPDGHWTTIPPDVIGVSFPRWLINAYWGTALTFCAAWFSLWGNRRWMPAMRRGRIVIGIFAAIVLLVMVLTSGAPTLDAAWLSAHGWPVDRHAEVIELAGRFSRLVRIGLWVLLAFTALATARRLSRAAG